MFKYQSPIVRVLLGTMLIVGNLAAVAAESSAAPPAAAPARDSMAMALILRMAGYLAAAPRFSVNIESRYDVVQESGEKIEFSDKRHVLVDRPGRVRVDIESSNGDQRLVLFDGKQITLSSPLQNVYAQTEQPGGIEESVKFFKQTLRLPMPLAPLLMKTLPDELQRRIVSVTEVETTKLFGQATHHLLARGDGVDLQLWIADGKEPLPVRIVMTYRDADGQPQYRADFSDWNLAPQVDASQFTYTVPAAATKIAFLNQLSRVAPPAPPGVQP